MSAAPEIPDLDSTAADRVFARLESVESVPTLPEVVTRLQMALNDPEVGLREIAELVEDDPSTTVAVLKIVNSPLYRVSSSRDCLDVFSAVKRLGAESLRNVVMTTSVLSAFSESESALFDRRAFWRHSISVGIVSAALYDFCGHVIPEKLSKDMLHLAGVVHDLGKIVLEQAMTRPFRRSIEHAQTTDCPLFQAEREQYGCDHAAVGGWLCRRWGLPQPLADVVALHHDPESAPEGETRSLTRIVHLANYLCHVNDLGSSGTPRCLFVPAVPRALGLDMARLAELMDVVEEEAAKSEILLALV